MLERIEIVFYLWCLVFYTVGATVDIKCESTRPAEETVVSELLNIAGDIIESAKKYEKVKGGLKKGYQQGKPIDCEDILSMNQSARSGVYKIWPRSRVLEGSINVLCDMDDNGGGWTIIQKRGDFDSGKEYFYQDWAAYKTGFGNFHKDFWLGNDNIYVLTNQRSCTVKFELSDWNGNWTYATYDEFWIDDEDRKYTVHVNGFRGTAGDSFTGANGAAFTTKDRDNDRNENNNCAAQYKGGWWYTNCHSSNLNGPYLRGSHDSPAHGVLWVQFKGNRYSLKDTIIKIRPKNFDATLTQARTIDFR